MNMPEKRIFKGRVWFINGLSLFAFGICMIFLYSKVSSFTGYIFMAAVSLWPMPTSIIWACMKQNLSLRHGMFSLLYSAWFGVVYADVFYIHPDPQGPLAFLFMSVVAIPLLGIVWIFSKLSAKFRHKEIR